jgi:hypothetical protein
MLAPARPVNDAPMWQDAASAPFDKLLELAVLDAAEVHAIVFPCRRVLHGWVNADTGKRIDVRPTHWRDWKPASAS